MGYLFLGLLLAVLGIGRCADIGYFWHVTDFHYDHTYATSKLSCNEEVPALQTFGDYWCDATWALVTDSVKSMARIKRDVDFLIWTGDTVAHIANKDMSIELNLQIIQNITDLLNTSFVGAPVYASLGNHDFYPNGQANYTEDEFYRGIDDMWRDWIIKTVGNKKENYFVKEGGYYSVIVRPGLRLLALNTNMYYTTDKLTAKMTDPTDQFKWMKQQLQSAKNKGEKVFVTGHVPPGLLFPGYADWFYPHFKKSFMDIIHNYSDIIVATHYGHDHMDSFKILQDEKGERAVTQFNAPSVTPWRFKIPIKTGDAHNPGIRLVKYNRVTGVNLDYTQYFTNITDANKENKANWTELYSFTTAYDVPDMSVPSLRKIFENLKADHKSKYYQRFCNYWVVSQLDKKCTEEMKADILCGGLNYNLAQAKLCSAERINSYKNDQTGLNGSFVTVMIYLVCLVALLLI
ncbi:acid sphingomyelinase-like phosphodiesterase 3b [Physella acuta]|uniref:acid sphingomyelinase-like phosphodiesterase 3b n=1 Tax=Physella acuta TaxID=109671 RepID=UPI0027DC3E2B|nr:acid sphingomyelinase-like phosphodiesterase 3b [Physella acuta]